MDSYDTPCRQDQIAEIVAALDIPVIANGDATDVTSVKRLLDHTACAGVMISRAGVGQPWIFAHIRAELAGETFVPPSLARIGDVFLQHVRGLINLEGEHIAILQSRKLIKYYARPLADQAALLEQVNQVVDLGRLESLTREYFNARMPPPFVGRDKRDTNFMENQS
jgi:tRNA-dihydrouridine synthase